jgi:hypothetical protein
MVYMTILSYYVLNERKMALLIILHARISPFSCYNITIMDIRRQCIKIWNFFKTKWIKYTTEKLGRGLPLYLQGFRHHFLSFSHWTQMALIVLNG